MLDMKTTGLITLLQNVLQAGKMWYSAMDNLWLFLSLSFTHFSSRLRLNGPSIPVK